jgi:hypothetical protein
MFGNNPQNNTGFRIVSFNVEEIPSKEVPLNANKSS